MVAFETFPDIEAMVAKVMRTAGVCSGRVYSSVPADAGSAGRPYPIARVQRFGGLPAEEHVLDMARIQVDVWGNNQAEAHDQAQLARRAIHQAEGYVDVTLDGYISRVADELGLQRLDDPETGRDRYLFVVQVYARSYVT
jgi:hypothetical protein